MPTAARPRATRPKAPRPVAPAATALALSPAGLAFTRGGLPLLAPTERWLEVRTHVASRWPVWQQAGADGLQTHAMGVAVSVRAAYEPGSAAGLWRLTFTARNDLKEPVELNLKWTLPLADQERRPRWLIPALLYKDNVQYYRGGPPSLVEPSDLAACRSDYWTFRADRTAVPAVCAWTTPGLVALVLEEHAAGHLQGVGLVNRAGERALVGCWPYREEPRLSRGPEPGTDILEPAVSLAPLAPGQEVTLSCWLYAGADEPYAFAPLLRETFARWDTQHPARPWFPTREAQEHAAHGLYNWHYDPVSGALWETCAYDRYFAKDDRFVDRYDMHTGFVSGIPYAFALRQFGLRRGRPDMAQAGARVIDLCCANLTPWGTFWSKFSRADGWTTGWPAPQRCGGQANLGSSSGELQARTLAEATLFAARAARAELAAATSRQRWTVAVVANLDFVCRTQRADGNVGQAYSGRDGSVLDWDGEEGLLWIAALVEGHRLTGDARYLAAAVAAGAYYAPAVRDAYLTGAPEGMHLLPTSEDAQNAVIAYALLWQATADAASLALAQQGAELLMTFRWQYNTVFDPRTILGRYDYRTKGLDVSSPNNVHLHPYGLIATPELLALWEVSGDPYWARQARNHLLGCHQMLAPVDGAFDARRGMMSERWHQTPTGGVGKGSTLQLAHAWASGLVLYADLAVEAYGHLLLDGVSGELIVLEALDAVPMGAGAWELRNPWDAPLDLRLTIRHARGRLTLDGVVHRPRGDLWRTPVTLQPHGVHTLAWTAGK